MKRKILIFSCLTALFSIILTAALIYLAVYQDFDAAMRRDALLRIFFIACVVAALVLSSAALISARVTRSIVKPINALNPGKPEDSNLYEDLAPLLSRMRRQNEAARARMNVTGRADRERLRREFTANVSHELKTPLTVVSGYAEIITCGLANPEDVPLFARKIYDEAQRLLLMIGDIITLSELDEGKIPSPEERVDLRDLALSAISRVGHAAELKSVTLTFSGESAAITGMRQVLEEMLFNLLDNSVKYNLDGGKVTVSLRSEARHVRLSVSDTGVGIAQDEQERIFERFYRTDKSRGGAVPGTGLGLSIV
ncbi:MAG: HAMP domain-containing histidine kinase, partial [Clostridiales Family XIII bacterium]|nr:HAMP domain-containing histidine kinase [Clostridiales Family XIII bacterium]